MVVAQVPLWIIHGTTPSGVGGGGVANATSTQVEGGNATNLLSATSTAQPSNDDMTKLLQNSRHQLHSWNNSNNISSSNNIIGKNNEKRSAIYCCDISLERVATGGGDGKIRIWNLNSLFQTTKVEPTSVANSNVNDDKDGAVNDNNDDKNDDVQMNDETNNKKTMGTFKRGGGYISSDSSECQSSVENGGVAATSNNNNENGQAQNTSIEPSMNGDQPNHQNHQQEQQSEQAVDKINDISSLVKRKDQHEKDTVIDAKTGKKRKRAELIQVIQRPPPQSLKSTTPTTSSANKESETATNNSLSSSSSMSIQKYDPKQRLLCTLSSHSGSVLTVRFSTSGKYLASAGDDHHVLLYTKTNKPSILTTGNLLSADGSGGGSEENENIEHWERIRILRGHNLDVVGLAWAPDDSHLVSCSLDSDSPICVWRLNLEDDEMNAENNIGGSYSSYHHDSRHQQHRRQYNGSSSTSGGMILHPYKVLGKHEHTSTVKGVAFDPAGKYMASSGDDPAICIWRAFDDWGLEARVDSSSGVFRSKKKSNDDGNNTNVDGGEEDMQALANLSLFRRISFAPDGTHVCGTNATLRGKNIAAMISRNGWGVSGVSKRAQSSAAGAANLVGHKQPVVSSRHCPYFFEVNDKNDAVDENDDDLEPQYSTLVALGDKKGFVSVWSTKKSRPIFKLQCSESKCTVTDISWGLLPSKEHGSIIMLVSMLDGFMVALKFDLPRELGKILSREKKHKIFRLKYGIELGSVGSSGRRLVDDKSGPKLIENVLQYEMEEDDEEEEEEEEGNIDIDESLENEKMDVDQDDDPIDVDNGIQPKQVETHTPSGKKRIQPVLLNDPNRQNGKSSEVTSAKKSKNNSKKSKSDANGVISALEKAASAAEGVSSKNPRHSTPIDQHQKTPSTASYEQSNHAPPISQGLGTQSIQNIIPPKTNQKAYTVYLNSSKPDFSVLEEKQSTLSSQAVAVTATCTNSTQSPPGIGKGVPCVTLSIIRDGVRTWRDHILGTTCTSFAACSSLIAVGTYDGSIYLYGTSPSSGWESGISFRSHVPLVMTGSIVHLCFSEKGGNVSNQSKSVEIIVLTSDGNFGVYNILPNLKVLYKGSISGPMNQMCLSTTTQAHPKSMSFPEVARIFTTDTGHLVLVLSYAKNTKVHVGGMIQGFVYSQNLETWLRISDDRFLYSNFYSSVPSSKLSNGLLSSLDETVKGCKNGNNNNRRGTMETSAAAMYYLNEDDEFSLQSFVTRAHCEDRLACAVLMRSKVDFEIWFSLYIRRLCLEQDSNQLRFVIDLLLNKANGIQNSESQTCWWISAGHDILGMKKKQIIEKMVIPELQKNRSMTRLVNEIITEISFI